MCYTGTCNSLVFNFWLEKKLIPELRVGQVLIMDNATLYKSQATHELIKKAGCEILFLPPYSPGLNLIETFWPNFKKIVAANLSTSSTLAKPLINLF
ncbi:transposase [Neochlamydia sp. AcF65]|uniref:transposase n=1 Tax=Neochlamydia sp. AcF65 TaxID=2795735 RepID=UPI0032D59BEC